MKSLPGFYLLLCVSAVSMAWGQGLAEISGTVRDATASAVPGADVVVSNASKGVHMSLKTSQGGVFNAPSLIPAPGYTVTVNKPGFSQYEVKDIDLEVGQNVNITAQLSVAAAATQVLQVEGTAPVVDETKTDVSQVVDSQQILDLPINGRRVDTFVLLAPAVTNDGIYGLLTFRGVANGNTFLVDGNDTTDQFWVENAGRTRTVSQLSQDAVQGFEVVSANFSAEYGRAMGGVVNTVTRSGTNDLHGTAFWFFRNQDFDARDPFTAFNPHDVRNQRGASLGGRIIKDKLFYFFNADLTNRNFPLDSSIIKANIVNTSTEQWVGCVLPATPAQCSAINGLLPRFFGVLPRTVTSDLGFGRIDYRLSDRNTISASMNFMHWTSPNGIQTGAAVTTGGAISSNGDSAARVREGKLAWTGVPTSHFVNEFRFGWLTDRQTDSVNPALTGSGLGSLYLSVAAQQIGSTYYIPRVEPNEQRFQFADAASWTKGAHTIKFGADIATTDDYSYFIQYADGYYTYQTVTAFAEDYSGATTGKNWQSYEQAIGNPVVDTRINDYGFYLQDQWRVTPKLTFNYGARYEYERIPQPKVCNPVFTQTCHINSPGTDLMPRLGIAYQVDNKTVVRAGYGTFYSRMAGATLQDLYSDNGVTTSTFTLAATQANQLAVGPSFPNILSAVPSGLSIAATSIQFAAPNLKIPYSEQGTLALEHQMAPDLAFTASYIWSRGIDLYSIRDLNLPAVSSTPFTYAIDNASNQQVGSYTTPVYIGSRPNGLFSGIYQDENGVTSFYNAFTLQINKRFSHGLQAALAYTWSHEIDDGQSYGQATPNLYLSSASNWLLNGNYKADKGNGLEDQPQRLVFSWVWMPTFTHRSGAFFKYVVNNWELSSITTINSSRPYGSPTIKVNDTPVPGMFSNFTINGSGLSSRVPFLPVNNVWQPAMYRADARISKILPIAEQYRLYLSFEVFNLSNSWSPTAMSEQEYTEAKGVLTLTPGAYGVGTSDGLFPDGTEARRMQLSARFTF